MLDRPHLQLLAAVQEMGRLGDAAKRLHISPSAASHRLAEAERRAGTTLTTTSGRTIRLTPAGVHLARSAAEIEDQIDRALLTARWIGGGETDRVRVAVGFYDTASWLLDVFAPTGGQARVELLRLRDDELTDAVRSGAADLAIAPWSTPPRGLGHLRLEVDVLVAAVPADSGLATGPPIEAAILEAETFLTSDHSPSRGFEFHEFFLAADVVPSTVVEIQSLETMLRLVGAGLGVTIQPALMLTWNRPHRSVAVRPLAGRDIAVTWTAMHRFDAPDHVLATAARIGDAFTCERSRRDR